MSADIKQLCGRVIAQERASAVLAGRVEEVAEQVEVIATTMATKDDVKRLEGDIKSLSENVDTRFNSMEGQIKSLAESTDTRFNHVYGVLADIQADTKEMRNILATLVQRLEK